MDHQHNQTQNPNFDNNQQATATPEAQIHGDILQAIFSHVPLVDLVPACQVSRSWNRAVFSSLRHFNKIKPWLVVHTQRTTPPHVTTTHAYDPRSQVWIQIKQDQDQSHHAASTSPSPSSSTAFLRSSHSTLLYTLSPSKFSFSFDPFHLTWHHVDAPRVWRINPVVAMVGDKVIVAGGACEFEEDPLAVETYSMETGTWEICQSIPTILKDSAAPTWLSAAVNSSKLYVTEKYSGVTYTFDPVSKTWSGPFDLRGPDQNVFYTVITFARDRLMVVGLSGAAEDVKSLKVWEVARARESLGSSELKEIGEMPTALLEKLKAGDGSISSIRVASMGGLLYVDNPSNSEEVVVCEIGDDGDDCCDCEWSGIKNAVVNDDVKIMNRLVLTCSSVGMEDLQRASLLENRRFVVKDFH